ncbi:helix-turn-helix domain-containing protein [Catenovulum sediminis]|uniref:Helix-turn-helix domain-containing protein n=1 Tax=Catenovulum sediminis TaxID=1740262 RepID=A0ABV1RCN4_9ALTE|nr:helix-turn-helix domain-containing protein [Catenovulum sediminis]
MTPQEIKDELNARGYTLAMLARAINKSPNTVSGVINRHITSNFIAEKLAKAIGKPVCEVFPEVQTYAKLRQQQEKQAELEQLLAS